MEHEVIFPGAYGGATSGAFSAAAFAFALGRAGQHASVDVRGLGTLLSFSVHSFLIGWLLEYSFCLLRYLCVLTNLLASTHKFVKGSVESTHNRYRPSFQAR